MKPHYRQLPTTKFSHVQEPVYNMFIPITAGTSMVLSFSIDRTYLYLTVSSNWRTISKAVIKFKDMGKIGPNPM